MNLLPLNYHVDPFNEWVLGHVQIYAKKLGGVLQIAPNRMACSICRNGVTVFVWQAGMEPRILVGKTLMSASDYAKALSQIHQGLIELLSDADVSQAIDDAIDNYLNGGSDGDVLDFD